MGKRRKQRKAAVDRDVISRLPDEILCHILSFLPTRTSMATSVLSRRWRYLWEKVQVLDLNDDFLYTHDRSDEEAEECFINFLEKVVSGFNPLSKVRLSCRADDYGYRRLFEWIGSVRDRVRELYFSTRTDRMTYTLPFEYIYSTSLVSLVLDGNINIIFDDVNLDGKMFLPSLKNLELHIDYLNIDVFLSGCPALETLRVTLIKFTTREADFDLEAIHMPRTLKSLTFEERYHYSEVVTLKRLQLDTTSLEYLHLALRCDYKRILVCDYTNIKKACLDIWPKPRNVAWVPKLLGALCETKFLWLKVSTIQCLLPAPVLDIPDFCNLIQLQLDFEDFKAKLLIDLLHHCPKLQALKIYVLGSYDGEDNFYFYYLNPHKRNGWRQPRSVPKCIVSHLNTVEYRGYQNTPEEHEFTTYILQRGLVLKSMRIHAKYYFPRHLKWEISQALSEIQMGSSMCRVEID
ncbi:FBD-associated F-box protein At2g26860-like [Arachis duranensis]|uniref:FBD-associated F-box protein At2g26860-like n=1 Tax=Arachis duranensis TaxID=130453 RepID=A0A6P5MM12_ARADU|nr:FBD-associated F-box protein At2g26860-like [Arachis duranensis]XP_025617733.1 FBD-associated F-box protein At2g26860 [Arachis hypogaea]XP_052109724.1 FBD-associated F-box protein At2g26860-like [Arachis duranensis]